MSNREPVLAVVDGQCLQDRSNVQRQPVIAPPMSPPVPEPRGDVVMRVLDGDPELIYWLYWPKRAGMAAPVLVTVHGISRNGFEQISAFTELADRYGVVLVAPLFTEARFPDYQRLGRRGRGRRADHALADILAEVGRLTESNTDCVHLFGYSGGAQFAHRYAMAYPDRIRAAAAAAAGWYTFPDPTRVYPYGIRSTTDSLAVGFDPARFLQVPMHVWVGERDVKCDAALRQTKRVNDQQGVNRVERAQRWVDAMRTAAKRMNLETSYSMTLLPRSNHSFQRCAKRGQLAKQVFAAFFKAGANPSGLNRDDDGSSVSRQR